MAEPAGVLLSGSDVIELYPAVLPRYLLTDLGGAGPVGGVWGVAVRPAPMPASSKQQALQIVIGNVLAECIVSLMISSPPIK